MAPMEEDVEAGVSSLPKESEITKATQVFQETMLYFVKTKGQEPDWDEMEDKLKQRIEDLRSEVCPRLDTFVYQLVSMDKDIKSLREIITSSQKHNEDRVLHYKEKIARMEQKVIKATGLIDVQVSEQKKKLNDQDKELKELVEQVQKEGQLRKKMEMEIMVEKQLRRNMRQELIKGRTELESLQTQLTQQAQVQEQIKSELKDNLKIQEDREQSLNLERLYWRDTIKSLQNGIEQQNRIQQQIKADLQDQLKTEQAAVQKLNLEGQCLRDEITSLQSQVVQQDRLQQQLGSELKAEQQLRINLKQEIQHSTSKLESLQSSFSSLSADISFFKDQADTKSLNDDLALHEINNSVISHDVELSKLREMYRKKEVEVEAKYKNLSEEYENFKKELESRNRQTGTLEAQFNSDLKAQFKALRVNLTSRMNSIEERIEGLQLQLLSNPVCQQEISQPPNNNVDEREANTNAETQQCNFGCQPKSPVEEHLMSSELSICPTLSLQEAERSEDDVRTLLKKRKISDSIKSGHAKIQLCRQGRDVTHKRNFPQQSYWAGYDGNQWGDNQDHWGHNLRQTTQTGPEIPLMEIQFQEEDLSFSHCWNGIE